MRVTVLASGSSGNATLFSWGDAATGESILVDAGIAPRALSARVRELGVARPRAIVITHAHRDHIGNSEELAATLGLHLYASESSARVMRLGGATVRQFGARQPFGVGGFEVAPLPIPHDAAQVAIVVRRDAYAAAVVTDLGEVPPALEAHLAACDVLCIESNYDEGLLATGPYPPFLKRRVASARGHLSNGQTHELLRRLSAKTRAVALLHLSRTNNRPDLAMASARDALGERLAAGLRLAAAPPVGCLDFDCATANTERGAPALARAGVQLALPGLDGG